MRKGMRRLLTFLLVLCISAYSLLGAGCGKDSPEKAASLNTPATSEVLQGGSGDKKESTQEADAQQKKYGDVKGFLWEARKGNAVVYMYGSIHVGDEDTYPLAKEVEDAFDSSKVVVGEIDITNTKALAQQALNMVYTNGDTAYDHMSAEGKKKIEDACKELSFNPRSVLNEKVWALASIVSDYQMEKAGYKAKYGIDMYFMNKAKGKKKIMEVEGAEFQFNLLNSFSDEEQEKYFVTPITTIDDTKKGMDEMFEAFKNGDEKAMLEAMGEDDRSSNFYKKMISDRNKNMAAKIEEYLNTEDTYFVVVGLAHYLGEDGVIKQLQDKGYTVTRK
ncbi:MAG: TraB/GumN family protein [Bacillota bacterium]|nr:TraB/GumN family protein [Bacillota bacterium]